MQIFVRGSLKRGVVKEFSNQTGKHEVEWMEAASVKVRRSSRGARQVEHMTWVDFATDPVTRCVND